MMNVASGVTMYGVFSSLVSVKVAADERLPGPLGTRS